MPAKSEKAKAYHRKADREEYALYKSLGICPMCRTAYGAPGHVYCEKCLAEKRRGQEKYRGAYNAAHCKERREHLKALGLCVCCGKPAVADRVLCAACARRNSEAQQVRKMKKRLERELTHDNRG